MKIKAICIGTPALVPGRKAKSGIYKHPVSGRVIIDAEGIAGDAVVNRKHHGGTEQAVYIEGALTLDWWEGELGRPLPPGTFGENIVIDGLDNRDVAAGDRFLIGEVVLEATSPRTPCAIFTAKMQDPGLARRYIAAARPGIYTRVIRPGVIGPDDPVAIQPFEGPRVTMTEMMATHGRRLSAEDRKRYLAAPVSAKIRETISKEKG